MRGWIRRLLGVALGVVLLAARAQAEWEDFGVGSWVHYRTTDRMPKAGVSEYRQTLIRRTPEEYVLRTENLVDGAWTFHKERTVSIAERQASAKAYEEEFWPEPKPEPKPHAHLGTAINVQTSTETLVIGGRKYVCQRMDKTFVKKIDRDSVRTVVSTWVSKEHGELRVTGKTPEGEPFVREVDPHATVAVDGTTYECRKTLRSVTSKAKHTEEDEVTTWERWVHSQHGELRRRREVASPRRPPWVIEDLVTTLGTKRTVGGRELVCRGKRRSSTGVVPHEGWTIRLETTAVPGGTVAVESKDDDKGRTVRWFVTELVAFEAKD